MSAEPKLTFTVDGRRVEAQAGQSVAAALLANGVETLTRSSKYRRPRGIYCANGHCPNCLVQIDGQPHVRSCMTPARDGLDVELESSTTARVDFKRAIDRTGRLFPVGFQYRYFKRQNVLWRLWEGQLRKAAAETPVPERFEVPAAARRDTDLVVVGGGPAGLGAAAAASDAGLSVVLVTRHPELGGRLRPALGRDDATTEIADAIATLQHSERVELLAPATVVACFGDIVWIDAQTHLVELTARASVLATGVYEQPIIFEGNDRPGVMLTSALRRLALEDRVLRGRSVALATRDDSAYEAALELSRAGIRVAALIDERPITHRAATELRVSGVELLGESRVTRVAGARRARRVVVQSTGKTRTLSCDFVGMSGGWMPADELRYVATSGGDDVVRGERAARFDLDGSAVPRRLEVLQGVGAVIGTHSAELAFAEGALAGRLAAGEAGPAATAAGRVRTLRTRDLSA